MTHQSIIIIYIIFDCKHLEGKDHILPINVQVELSTVSGTYSLNI